MQNVALVYWRSPTPLFFLGLMATHVGLSAISMGKGALMREELEFEAERDDDRGKRVARTVTQMYTGGGLDVGSVSEDVVFEDPVALCHGVAEVAEAFRALKKVAPVAIEVPLPVWRGTSNDIWNPSNTVVMRLRQSYMGFLTVTSSVVVTTDDDGTITRFEERWNHASLLPFVAGVRRANGLISYALTSLVIPN
jgi:hypothetical protein